MQTFSNQNNVTVIVLKQNRMKYYIRICLETKHVEV